MAKIGGQREGPFIIASGHHGATVDEIHSRVDGRLRGPTSTMTVRLGAATAEFFIERGLIMGKGHSPEDTFEAHEGMDGNGSTALEYIVAALTLHDNGIAAICGLA
jgi:hypothetical protein